MESAYKGETVNKGENDDLNNHIFEAISEAAKTGIDTDLLLKICSNTASENEKKQWEQNLDTMEVSKDINEKLSECFNMGYSIAEELDSKKKDDKSLDAEYVKNSLEDLWKEIHFLKSRIDELVKKE